MTKYKGIIIIWVIASIGIFISGYIYGRDRYQKYNAKYNSQPWFSKQARVYYPIECPDKYHINYVDGQLACLPNTDKSNMILGGVWNFGATTTTPAFNFISSGSGK